MKRMETVYTSRKKRSRIIIERVGGNMLALAQKMENNSGSTISSLDEYKKRKSSKVKDGWKNPQSSTRWVDPIRSDEDIQKIIEYLHDKAKYATRKDTKLAAYRDYLLFITGITVALRVSDLHKLKWDDFFMPDMKTFRDVYNVKEKKTGKLKRVFATEPLRIAILEYFERTGREPKSGEYMFLQSRIGSDGQYHHITRAAVEDMIKDAAKKCNIKGNYNTHSLRKTCAWKYYMSFVNSSDSIEQMTALGEIQRFLNHSTPSETLVYLGITRDKEMEKIKAMGDDYKELMYNTLDNETMNMYAKRAEIMAHM